MSLQIPTGFFFLFSLTLINGIFLSHSHILLPTDQQRTERITHIHFYYHDIRNNNNPTIAQIIDSPKNMPNGFGATFVMDDAMTEGPELSSKHIGRAQGLFGLASLQDMGMFMLTNFAFSEGSDYGGSTLSMLGRNPIAEQNREMPIVGGTGVFRFARGYAIANSVDSISTQEHFVVEYNITVSHP